MKIKLFYRAIDCGDGSVSVEFFKNEAELDAAIEEAEANDDFTDNNASWEIIDTDDYEEIDV